MLSEISQTKTNTLWFHLYVESKKQNKWTNRTKQKQRNTVIQRKKVKMHESIQQLWDSINQNALFESQKKEKDRIDILKDNGLGFSKNI